MGGDHGIGITVPHWKQYDNWKEYPELVEHQQRLSRLGLKDPWIRNQAFGPKMEAQMPAKGFAYQWHIFKSGWKRGIGIAAAFIAVEELYSYARYGYTSWNKPHH